MFPQELEQQFERERLSLEEHKTLLRQQLDELREELTSKLTAANEEVGETLLRSSPVSEKYLKGCKLIHKQVNKLRIHTLLCEFNPAEKCFDHTQSVRIVIEANGTKTSAFGEEKKS